MPNRASLPAGSGRPRPSAGAVAGDQHALERRVDRAGPRAQAQDASNLTAGCLSSATCFCERAATVTAIGMRYSRTSPSRSSLAMTSPPRSGAGGGGGGGGARPPCRAPVTTISSRHLRHRHRLRGMSLVVPDGQQLSMIGLASPARHPDALAVELAGDRLGAGVGEPGVVAVGQRQPGEQVERSAVGRQVADIIRLPVEIVGDVGQSDVALDRLAGCARGPTASAWRTGPAGPPGAIRVSSRPVQRSASNPAAVCSTMPSAVARTIASCVAHLAGRAARCGAASAARRARRRARRPATAAARRDSSRSPLRRVR